MQDVMKHTTDKNDINSFMAFIPFLSNNNE
jgi:hypothetical protein